MVEVSNTDHGEHFEYGLGDFVRKQGRSCRFTVRGKVAVFRFADFAVRYGLGDAAVLKRFENRKVLVATTVRSWS